MASNTNIPPQQPTYEPTAEQSARVEALKRHNRFTLYTPLFLIAVPIIILSIIFAWFATVGEDSTLWQGRLSSVADMVIILTTIPLLLICAILPIGAIALIITGKQNEWAPIQRIRILLWRLEHLIGRAQGQIDHHAPQLVEKTIEGNRRFAYGFTLITRLAQTVFGSSDNRPQQPR